MSQRRFIKIDPHLASDEKLLLLACELDEEGWITVGRLTALWSWAFQHRPDGSLSDLSETQVGLIMHLARENHGGLFALLERCGFLDPDNGIHSWGNWGGALFADRQAAAERKSESRGCHSDVTVMSSRAKNEREIEKEQDQGQEPSSDSGESNALILVGEVVDSHEDDFEVWWSEYNRIGSKADAKDCYLYWRKHGASADELLFAADRYQEHCERTQTSIKHGATFLAKRICRWREWLSEEHGDGNSPSGSGNLSDVLAAASQAFNVGGSSAIGSSRDGQRDTRAIAGGQDAGGGVSSGGVETG
jgi:hypothetical protein